ncbi:sarcosine oxidase subunit delta, partial [Acinetobacter baumannii]|nr:sarcosine oxidase subunit delta [Acinetobacter baumannii]
EQPSVVADGEKKPAVQGEPA